MKRTIEKYAIFFAGWILNQFTPYKMENVTHGFRVFLKDIEMSQDPELYILETTRGVVADVVNRLMKNGSMDIVRTESLSG